MNNPSRILVLERDMVSASILVEDLEARNYAVHVACNQLEGLRQLALWIPDLITTDLVSFEDGIDFCRQIRATSDVPIMVISGRIDEASKVKALDAGANDYVTKPFSVPEVAARIRAQLRRRALYKSTA